jgi:hypothetical protein
MILKSLINSLSQAVLPIHLLIKVRSLTTLGPYGSKRKLKKIKRKSSNNKNLKITIQKVLLNLQNLQQKK